MTTKRLFIVSLISTLCLALFGCVSFHEGHIAAARNGARILTREILIEKPDAKPKFEKAMAELAELQKLETVKTTDLLAIVNRIPKESRTVRLTVDGVTTVIYIAGDPTILPSETTAQLKLVAAALEAGIRDGMAEVP